MDKYEIRRLNLIKIKDKFCGGKNIILAHRIDKDATYVSRMLYIQGKNGKKNISKDMAEHIEKSFGLPKRWMDNLEDLKENTEILASHFILSAQSSFPLLTSAKASEFHKISYTELIENAPRIPSYKKPTGHAFWLIVEGDSMTAPIGVSPSFPNGMLILVDAGVMPKNGEFCVANCEVNQTTFKKFSVEEGLTYLKPLNNQYQMIQLNTNCKIIGKVIEAKWDL